MKTKGLVHKGKYRVAVFSDFGSIPHGFYTLTADTEAEGRAYENRPDFLGWITTWTDYLVAAEVPK